MTAHPRPSFRTHRAAYHRSGILQSWQNNPARTQRCRSFCFSQKGKSHRSLYTEHTVASAETPPHGSGFWRLRLRNASEMCSGSFRTRSNRLGSSGLRQSHTRKSRTSSCTQAYFLPPFVVINLAFPSWSITCLRIVPSS